MTMLTAGFVLGLAGSVHCLAMCGPLVGVAASVSGPRRHAVVWYQVGRLSGYVLIGAIAGLVGQAAWAGGMGRSLAVGAGVVLILSAIGYQHASRLTASRWITVRLSRGLSLAARLRTTHPITASMAAGLVNGLLPCGLVYAAVLGAVAAGSTASAILLMVAFGLGTLPVMTTVWFSSSFVPIGVKRRLKLMAPLAIALVGVLLIGRGLGDGGHHFSPSDPSGSMGASGALGASGSRNLHSH